MTAKLPNQPRLYPEGIRVKGKVLEWRFKYRAEEYHGVTDLVAVPENGIKAALIREKEIDKLKNTGKKPVRLKEHPLKEAVLEYCDHYKGEHPDTRGNWINSIMSPFLHYFTYIDKTKLSQINPGKMERFKTWRRNDHIDSETLRKNLNHAADFFSYATKQGWVEGDPMHEVEIPSAKRRSEVMRVLSVQETVEVIDTAYEISTDLADAYTIMLNQGPRPEEVMSLPKSAINLEKRYFTIGEGKTDSATRTLRIIEATLPVFTRRMELPGRWLFPSEKLAGDHRTTLQKAHEKVVRDTDIHYRIYDMRHTFATRFACRPGSSLPALAMILGHCDLTTLHHYVHPSQDFMDKAMEAFEKHVAVSSEMDDMFIAGGQWGGQIPYSNSSNPRQIRVSA